MKFDIFKIFIALSMITLCVHLVSSLQTKSGMATNLNLGLKSKSGMNMNMYMRSNYKMSLGSLLDKSHKKIQTNIKTSSNILFNGWLKYFKFPDDDTQKKPKEFFKNPLYHRDSLRKHAEGEVKIPSEKHFYAILFPDNLNIYTTNNKASAQYSSDVLSIDFIRSIPENKQTNGGVRDFGQFSEGFCFQVKTIIPKDVFKISPTEFDPKEGVKEKWLICLDTEKEKSSLMNLIIKNKIRKQEESGVIIKAHEKSDLNLNLNINNINRGNTNTNSVEGLTAKQSEAAKVDGRWVVLQDWTQCSLSCGGGIQTLQLMCHPPQNGGNPCKGAAIRTRPCNPQPCPVLKVTEKPIKFEKLIVKMMPLTNRPTRYDKCHLKESDIFAVIKQKGVNLVEQLNLDPNYLMSNQCEKIPARVVMTNKSISVFKNENLDSIIFISDLNSVSLMRIKNSEYCFILQGKSENQQIIVCAMESKPAFIEEWDYDFSLFKHQCQEKRPVIKLAEDNEAKLKFREGVQKLKTIIIEEKAEKAREASEKEEELEIKKEVDNTQSMTFLAMQKEMKLEAMLQKEEELREKEDESNLDTQLKQEEKKKDILMKSIKEKELEEQFNISRENAKLAINKIKDEARNNIIKKRNEIKKKINLMRLKSERKKMLIKSRIMSMRSETAQKLQFYSKKGAMEKCFLPNPEKKEDAHNIEVYCAANFNNEMTQFMECKVPETFCYTCCEREFGPVQLVLREKCYNERCNALK